MQFIISLICLKTMLKNNLNEILLVFLQLQLVTQVEQKLCHTHLTFKHLATHKCYCKAYWSIPSSVLHINYG